MCCDNAVCASRLSFMRACHLEPVVWRRVIRLSRYLYLNHVAHLTFTELIISYIFLSFFHFEFSPSSGVSCHAAAGGERCLRRRAPRAPRTRTRARQRTAEKVCRKVCVQCECRAVPGPRDASRVVVARRDGSGLERPRVRAASTAHATADGTRRRTNLRHRSQASLRIGCAGRCVRAEGGPGPCGRAARRRLTRPGRAGGTWHMQTVPGWTVENWSHHKVDSLTCIKNEIEEREDGPGTGGRAPGRGRGSAAPALM